MDDFELSPEDLRRLCKEAEARAKREEEIRGPAESKTTLTKAESEASSRAGEPRPPVVTVEAERVPPYSYRAKSAPPNKDEPSGMLGVFFGTLGFLAMLFLILGVQAISGVDFSGQFSMIIELVNLVCFAIVLISLYRHGETAKALVLAALTLVPFLIACIALAGDVVPSERAQRVTLVLAMLSVVLVGALATLVIGCRRVKRYDLANVMGIWTACFLFLTLPVITLTLAGVQLVREAAQRDKLGPAFKAFGLPVKSHYQDKED